MLFLLPAVSWAGMAITSEDIPLENGMWGKERIQKSGSINDDYKIITKVEGRKMVQGVNAFIVKEQTYEGIDSWLEYYAFKDDDKLFTMFPENMELYNGLVVYGYDDVKIVAMKFPLFIGVEWKQEKAWEMKIDGVVFVVGFNNKVVSEEEISVNSKTYKTLKKESKYYINEKSKPSQKKIFYVEI